MSDTHQDQPLEKYSSTSSNDSRQAAASKGSARDLGTAGGGNIPASGGVSKDTVLPAEAGVPASEGQDQNNNANTIDTQAQANLGGRNPGQTQSAMGDQDSTQSRPGNDPTDPMTSRAPDRLKKQE